MYVPNELRWILAECTGTGKGNMRAVGPSWGTTGPAVFRLSGSTDGPHVRCAGTSQDHLDTLTALSPTVSLTLTLYALPYLTTKLIWFLFIDCLMPVLYNSISYWTPLIFLFLPQGSDDWAVYTCVLGGHKSMSGSLATWCTFFPSHILSGWREGGSQKRSSVTCGKCYKMLQRVEELLCGSKIH